ncbi:GGDEF domain-containing protein [Dechloromonas denitrificans]|uniref:sensor domain-containing diguanylate cyclase n=1 Tax=Dechloromonas denitrificans TaxID=281362 RepID=UPI001CF88CA6|nr:sensor domain-containing diguanylate cyclase [Dechloromonas denitrificans]UCV11199.1 GGDEF domain-containing protein [Dechloromonas denitrificans]
MWPHLGSSLRTRIAAVAGLLFLIGIGLTTFFVARILYDEMQAMLFRQQLTTANYIARDIDSKLSLRMDSLKRVADNLPHHLLAKPKELQDWLDDRKAIHTLFPTGLMIIPPDGGAVLADSPRLESRPKSFVDRDWFISATTTRRATFSKPLVARATQQPAIVLAIPIFDDNQQLIALMAGVTPLTSPGFLDLIQGTAPGKTGSYQLISPRHHSYALTSDPGKSSRPLPEAGHDLALDRALAGVRGIDIVRNSDNINELIATVEIPQTGWLLIARCPTSEAFAPVWNSVRNTLLIAGLLSLPIIILLLAALNRLLAPLGRLAKELHDMSEGTRPMQPLLSEYQDEVGDVASSFNRLQEKLLEQERRLAEMAHHDPLTGLPNRLLINNRLDKELQRIRRSGRGLALLFLDLDGFKPVNDLHGHQVGDLLLTEIAHRLQGCIREVDTVARLGGDEFLILVSDCEAPRDAAERIAEACIAAIGKPVRIDDLAIRIGVSIGISFVGAATDDMLSASQLLSQADIAMYRAKADGRNRYSVYRQNNEPSSKDSRQKT